MSQYDETPDRLTLEQIKAKAKANEKDHTPASFVEVDEISMSDIECPDTWALVKDTMEKSKS